MSADVIIQRLNLKTLPSILTTYLFCSPALNGELRCLPRGGGYLDQDHIDMIGFRVIEGRIYDWNKRQTKKHKNLKSSPRSNKAMRSVTTPLKDL